MVLVCGMRFINLVDVEGKRHVVNPLHITAIDEADAGCVVHFRGRDTLPIVLNDTIEVMSGALESCEMDRALTTAT
jgi:hypothetical protein